MQWHSSEATLKFESLNRESGVAFRVEIFCAIQQQSSPFVCQPFVCVLALPGLQQYFPNKPFHGVCVSLCIVYTYVYYVPVCACVAAWLNTDKFKSFPRNAK